MVETGACVSNPGVLRDVPHPHRLLACRGWYTPSLLGAIACFAAEGCGAAQRAPPAGARQESALVVRPEFNWPIGLAVTVETDLRRSVTSGDRSDSSRLLVRFTMSVDSVETGRFVRHSGHTILASSGTPSVNQLAVAVMPGYLVTESGAFLGVPPSGPDQAPMDSAIRQIQRFVDSMAGTATTPLHAMFSEQLWLELARRDWRAHVEAWLGESLQLGITQTASVDEALPLLSGAVVPTVYEFGAQDTVPCVPRADRAECVQFHMTARHDPEVLKSVLLGAFTSLMPDSVKAATRLPELQVENSIRLVARPKSLLPYRLEVVQYMRVLVVSLLGQALTTSRETRSQTYTYPP